MYLDGQQWFLVDSISSSDEFHHWITGQPRRFDAGFHNPFYPVYTFFNWSRLTGGTLSFRREQPLPTYLVVLTENPPLLAAAAKVMALGAFLGLILLRTGRHRRAMRAAITADRSEPPHAGGKPGRPLPPSEGQA